ncbi:peptidoglycan-associated lipoprotein precursor [mine drainage metagenome]|uniref:Peptidoglycan-associated lipoprotein n=1 Tax=mine drainage metagenome TaxID=410659 RepID=A0A1J5ST59_9ZZZZ
MKSYIAALLVTLSLVACASSNKNDTSKSPSQDAAKQTQADAGSAQVAAAEQAQLLQQLKKDSVYFDYREAAVKSEFGEAIKKQAEFMRAHKGDTVTLEGNCDERGSAKYNLALGSRRADAVSRQLQLLGVPKEQIRLISYGKDKPRSACHDESCWKDNRRVDFNHSLNQ